MIQSAKTSEEDVQKLACSCFRLNSLQMAALLSQEKIPPNLVDTAVRMAESVADELTRVDDRKVCSIQKQKKIRRIAWHNHQIFYSNFFTSDPLGLP